MTGGSGSSVRLEIAHHVVSDIRLSDSCKLENGILSVGRRQIETLMSPGIRLEELAICKPGQSVRIAPVLDVVEPRAKEEATAAAFQGFFAKDSSSSGHGRTHALKGVAVVGVAELPGVQEGLIDMQADADSVQPVRPDLEHRAAFRQAASDIRAPGRCGYPGIHRSGWRSSWAPWRSAWNPTGSIRLEWPLPESRLPKAALVYFVQSQGDLRRTYLNGQPLDAMLPMRDVSAAGRGRRLGQRKLRHGMQQDLHLHPSEQSPDRRDVQAAWQDSRLQGRHPVQRNESPGRQAKDRAGHLWIDSTRCRSPVSSSTRRAVPTR